MPTSATIPDSVVETLVKRSTKASKVPLRLKDLVTSHVVAQTFAGVKVSPPA